MNVGAPFVAHPEPAELVEPGEGAFDHPAIGAKAAAMLNPPVVDEGQDVAAFQCRSDALGVVCLVGKEDVRSAARPATAALDPGYGVYDGDCRHRIVDIGACQADCERNAAAVRDEVPLRAGFRSISRVSACLGSPFTALIADESRAAHSQVMRFWRPSSSRIACQRASQTPQVCQSLSRRQQVTPEPQPISWGSHSQGMPVRKTKRMPVMTARLEILGLPPLGFGGSGGRMGSMMSQSASGSSGLAKSVSTARLQRCHLAAS